MYRDFLSEWRPLGLPDSQLVQAVVRLHMQGHYFWEVPVHFDNPRRLTITLTFPAPGNTELNEIAVNALKDLVATAKTPEDMRDKVLMAGTPHEIRVQVTHEFLEGDDAGNLHPESD